MRKLFLLILLMPLVLMGCDTDTPVKNSTPSFDNVDFTKYDSFVLAYDVPTARSVSTSKNLYGVTEDDEYEKITITSENGDTWKVLGIEKAGGTLMTMELQPDEGYDEEVIALVNVDTNEAYDLTTTVDDVNFELSDVKAYRDGLMVLKGGTVYRINLDDESLVPINNPDADYCTGYYVNRDGHVIMATRAGVPKMYPANGSTPYNINGVYMVNDIYGSCVTTEDLDYIADIAERKIVRLTNDGPVYTDIDSPYLLFRDYITPKKGENGDYPPRDPSTFSRVVHDTLNFRIAVSEIVDGELKISMYEKPFSWDGRDPRLIIGDTIIYEQDRKIFTWELGAPATEMILDNFIDWDVVGHSIVYRVYESATEIATYMYDIDTKTTSEKITGAVPQILKLVSF